jgi:hypothetical protein
MKKLYSYVLPPWIVVGVVVFILGGFVLTKLFGPGSDLPRVTCKAAKSCVEQGKQFFKDGYFQPAEQAFKKTLEAEPENAEALAQLGRLAFYSNNLKEAEAFSQKALALDTENKIAKEILPLVYYRSNDFAKAAPLIADLGNQAQSDRFSSFETQALYQVEATSETLRIPFIKGDPVPVVRVSVNGGAPVDFIIDTGAAEMVIDKSLASQAETKTFGKSKGGYTGSLQTDYEYGRVDSIAFAETESSSRGNWVIKNVPVHVQDLSSLRAVYEKIEIKGIIGTNFLYQFIATIDYPENVLILRKKEAARSEELLELAKSTKEIKIVPFWLTGDHYIVARGTINKSASMLFFIDTGLAGGGFSAPPSSIRRANVNLSDQAGMPAEGHEGKERIVGFTTDLTLGEAKVRGVLGVADIFPEKLEYQFGFRIGGLVSHQFFHEYAVTFDFISMNLFLEQKEITQ